MIYASTKSIFHALDTLQWLVGHPWATILPLLLNPNSNHSMIPLVVRLLIMSAEAYKVIMGNFFLVKPYGMEGHYGIL